MKLTKRIAWLIFFSIVLSLASLACAERNAQGYLVELLVSPEAAAAQLDVSENIHSIWANKSGLSGEFMFIALGDSRGGDKVYARILEKAALLNPLFILHTGDMVNHGYKSELEHYAGQVEGFDIPIVHVPGNHDVEKGRGNYEKYFGSFNWYFDYGEYRFVGLDNSGGRFSADTLKFARKFITRERKCFALFHKPPAVGRWKVHSMDDDAHGGGGGEMMEIINSAGALMVFLGHIHLYDEMDIEGVRYVITGGAGSGLYAKYGFGKPEYGFVVVRVNPDGIAHEWVPLDED